MTRDTATAPASCDASGLVTEGKALSNRAARSGTTIHGWPALLVGLLVTGVGLAFAGVTIGLILPGGFDHPGMPGWILAVVGGAFAFAGMSVLIHGVRGIGRQARVRRMRAARPAEPWQWDHPWDQRVARDDTASRVRHFLVAALFLVAFLTPFHWIGFFGPKVALPFGIAALLFDAAAVGLLAAAGYFTLRRLKYGRGVARFAHFPFRRGSTLELYVDAPRALPQHALAMATLRCVQERYVTTGTGEEQSLSVECFEVYRDTGPAELVSAGAGRRAMRVSFAIPADVPATDLSSRPCRYWEIDVEAVTNGVDYGARFLVPVY